MPQNVPTALGRTALRQRNALCGSEKNKCKRLKPNEMSLSPRHGRLSPSRAICPAAALRARKWYLGLLPTSNGLRSAHLLSRKLTQCRCRLTLHGRLVKTSHNRCHSNPRLHRPSHLICILNQHPAFNKQLSKNHLIIMAKRMIKVSSDILQWNIRGLQANREELNILLSDFNPTIVSLEETFLNAIKATVFKNYSFYSRPGEESNGTNLTVHGGVAILVNNTVPHSHIQLNTSLQAIAIRATCHRTISVCSIYLPPLRNLTAVILTL